MNEEYTVEELEQHLAEVKSRLREIDAEFGTRPLTDDADAEFKTLRSERKLTIERIAHLKERKAYIASLENDEPGRTEDHDSFAINVRKDPFDMSSYRASTPEKLGDAYKDGARRALETAKFPHIPREVAQDAVDKLLTYADTRDGVIARRILVTGSPDYQRAFGKTIAGQSPTEVERAALAIGADATGGFAVPFTLDPTVLPTSNGAVNPLRAISRTETIATDKWNGISSAGVVASYKAEAAEATDDAPTLAQPSVSVHRADAFVPFSIEVGQDWSGLQAEMARMFSDAKDELEADKFVNGSGTDEPFGIVQVIDGVAGSKVPSAGIGAFAAADVYAVEEALPPRFRAVGRFLANKAIYNKVRQFDSAGGAQLWERIGNGQPSELLGYSAHESSSMETAVAAGDFPLLFGDFRHFLIVDRVGMSVELLPHLLGTNRRPTGERGLFAYWRNGSDVLVQNAFRLLEIRAA